MPGIWAITFTPPPEATRFVTRRTAVPNMPRLDEPNPEAVMDYIARRQPVVIKGLFKDQPLRSINTAAAAIELLGDCVVELSLEYGMMTVASLDPRVGEVRPNTTLRKMSLREYLGSDTKEMVIERALPPELIRLYEVPVFCQPPFGKNLIQMLFFGKAGNSAHFHYDRDFRQVVMYQVFGRKTYYVAQPEAATKLAPVANSSSFFVEHMSAAEKRAFFEYVGADVAVLEPGEAVLMPGACWHYVDYEDPALSFNLRFDVGQEPEFLRNQIMKHCTTNMQYLGSRFARGRLDDDDRTALEELRSVVGREYSSSGERFQAIEAVAERAVKRMCPSIHQLPLLWNAWPEKKTVEERLAVFHYDEVRAGRRVNR
jgi:hypothetical protein